jgi:uncharacterized protein YdiU (UPF0061 family)
MPFTMRGNDVCSVISPSPLPAPYWVALSPSAADLIGLRLNGAGLPQDPQWLQLLAGNTLSVDGAQFSEPLAIVYSGHQFGVWAGQLGDGRAILLGDTHGQELQLKGAGRTPYSRMGDGRAVLRSSIREFLCSEAMHALGIPTSRALAIVGSKQPIRRETMETAAVCSRLAPSFIRIGHFEHFAATQNIVRLKELADLLITHFYPECAKHQDQYLSLFKAIALKNAQLVAKWQSVGFCHGVLNSDNISALGLTIDYGPFGFVDHFEIDHICNHSDHAGRYAYHRQPQIMHWNMACLASAMLPLLEFDHSAADAQALLRSALEEFPIEYASQWQDLFRHKLGFFTAQDGDIELIERLLQAMHDSRIDFTSFFRSLSEIQKCMLPKDIAQRNDFLDRDGIDIWFQDYLARLQKEVLDDAARKLAMDQVNPKYVLRNHLAQVAIEKAQEDDFSEVTKLLQILSKPYDEQLQYGSYALPPSSDLNPVAVSCSS